MMICLSSHFVQDSKLQDQDIGVVPRLRPRNDTENSIGGLKLFGNLLHSVKQTRVVKTTNIDHSFPNSS